MLDFTLHLLSQVEAPLGVRTLQNKTATKNEQKLNHSHTNHVATLIDSLATSFKAGNGTADCTHGHLSYKEIKIDAHKNPCICGNNSYVLHWSTG